MEEQILEAAEELKLLFEPFDREIERLLASHTGLHRTPETLLLTSSLYLILIFPYATVDSATAVPAENDGSPAIEEHVSSSAPVYSELDGGHRALSDHQFGTQRALMNTLMNK